MNGIIKSMFIIAAVFWIVFIIIIAYEGGN